MKQMHGKDTDENPVATYVRTYEVLCSNPNNSRKNLNPTVT